MFDVVFEEVVLEVATHEPRDCSKTPLVTVFADEAIGGWAPAKLTANQLHQVTLPSLAAISLWNYSKLAMIT